LNDDNLISVVIPTYKEKENIAPLVERLSRTFEARKYEILFVDDNSNDGTIDLISEMAASYPVKVIVRLNERGLATAVLHGIKFARGNIIGVMDADLQHPPETNSALLEALEKGADMAVASRYIPGGGCPNWGLTRRIISRGAISLAHVLLPGTRKVKDPVSGFFMFKRDAVDGVELRPKGYKILLEMLVIGHFQNVVEVPFIFEDRSSGSSKMKARQQIDYLQQIFSLMRRTGELLRFLKFIGVGLSGTVVNLGILRLVNALTGWSGYLALVPGIEVSIITNFLLNDFFTFSDRRSGKVKSVFGRLLKYNLVALTGAIINYAIAAALFTVGVNIYLADFAGIVVAFLWNYFFSTVWAWK
jgi:dolichol-phosphate mannosyltransferase